ncbi:Fe(2+) transport protein 3 [Pyrenophora tritici-repentis Pt-1C-BFP]|uniref:Fe(2+) transport protein 3 n=1 Tax=Pyrenophora tritici-repentis (strain Pt-1C-BFP) TaxID=426418 RepID=B2WPN6_PYRTR|nr:Fe(2+) transport protein 3 [Pyrenophora tritici-repentis Pt-1C-BFP]EDU46102.1 Fe(2+) transport protein 3 [Pyrenophora tritici-repentis Pt-1C-BFP]
MSPDVGMLADLSQLPAHILHAELLRRQQDGERPKCETKGGKGTYNTLIHVLALLLILVLSTAACSFPIVVKRFPSIPVPHQFLFLSRHFGTGVLIATAFVHLLPTAFESLTHPCLPHFWNHRYPAMPGLVAMTSVFVVVGIEMFFAARGAGHVHAAGLDNLGLDGSADARPGHKRSHSYGRYSNGTAATNGHAPGIMLHDVESSAHLMAGRSPSFSVASPLTPDPSSQQDSTRLLPSGPHAPQKTHSTTISPEKTDAQNKKLLLQCLLLEAGILFHSIFIGMALSVATGTSFAVLLTAISFHQTFEGFALGARISAIRFPPGSPKPWLMALAYGATTPIGQAIGLAIHTLYDPASEAGLLTVGFMNAACASVVGGALLMAMVGAWA